MRNIKATIKFSRLKSISSVEDNYSFTLVMYFFSSFSLQLQTKTIIRSSHRRCSVKKGVLKNFTKFTGKHLFQSLLFNNVAGLMPATLLKNRLWRRCFPVNFVKILRTPFLQNTSVRLLLYHLSLWKKSLLKLDLKKYEFLKGFFKGNAQFIQNTTFGFWENIYSSTPKNVL